jgi:hypothetical protein
MASPPEGVSGGRYLADFSHSAYSLLAQENDGVFVDFPRLIG